MTSMLLYLCGPIFGGDDRRSQKEKVDLFDEWEAFLTRQGHDVVTPKNTPACGDSACVLRNLHDQYPEQTDFATQSGTHTEWCFNRHLIPAMLRCSGIVMMPFWEWDPRCRLEHQVAVACGMRIAGSTFDGSTLLPLMIQ